MGNEFRQDPELASALAALGETPARLNDLMQRLPSSLWNTRPSPGWSFVENMCHLRDLEIEGYAARITRILEEDNPSLPDFDGPGIAKARNYIEQDALQALRDFTTIRAKNVDRLSALDAASFDRPAALENTGAITLRKLVDAIREHDGEHLDELAALCRSLGPDNQPGP